jgi:hypothetical protein
VIASAPAEGARREDHREPFAQIDHFGAQVAYFSDCIATGTPREADGEEGLADMRALIAIERALLTGQPQPIASPSALPSSNSRPCAIDTSDRPADSFSEATCPLERRCLRRARQRRSLRLARCVKINSAINIDIAALLQLLKHARDREERDGARQRVA